MNGSELAGTLLRGAVALGLMPSPRGSRRGSDAAGRPPRGDPPTPGGSADPEVLLRFWFGDEAYSAEHVGARSALWFGSDARFDQAIREGFGDWPERAEAGEFRAWEDSPRSALALVLTLDQLPRNLHRGDRRAFAFDPHALELALRCLDRGFDRELHPVEAVFLYLPLEHAEDIAMQNRCVDLFARVRERSPGELRENFGVFCSYAERHRAVIERFGRFPHRNEILDRVARAEETAWLRDGGDRFGA